MTARSVALCDQRAVVTIGCSEEAYGDYVTAIRSCPNRSAEDAGSNGVELCNAAKENEPHIKNRFLSRH